MEKVSAKTFFAVLWKGVCQALGWFLGLFGYKRDGKFARCVWGLFATSAAVVMAIIAIGLLREVGGNMCRWASKSVMGCRDKDCGYWEYVAGDIYYHDHYDGKGYIYNKRTGKKLIKRVEWIHEAAGSTSEESTPAGNPSPKGKKRWWIWLSIALLLNLACLAYWMMMSRPTLPPSTWSAEPFVDSTQNVTYEATVEASAYVEMSRDSINDIALRIYAPVGGHAELLVGPLPNDDRSIILAAQAADYRADNGQIAGAFVYRGELLSRGHPKYGFCAIIGDKLTMGMSSETALFERAVEQEGYFFRQFSLVHDAGHGESVPKGKSVRRALCYYRESIVIIESVERESMHDFSTALIDLGVQEAIALVGNTELTLYEDEAGNRFNGETGNEPGVQETYIIWRR